MQTFKFVHVVFILIVCSTIGCDSASGEPEIPEVIWSFDVENSLERKTQPVIDGNRVFVASDSRIRCFELDSGELCWETEELESGIISAHRLLQDERNLYVNDGKTAMAFSKADGTQLWSETYLDFDSRGFSIMTLDDTHLYIPGRGEVLKVPIQIVAACT